MRAIYFIESNTGEKHYKTDTFWSKSNKHIHAKIHDDSQYDQKRFFESLIYGFKPYKDVEWSDSDYHYFKKYEGGKYGFQRVLDPPVKETTWTLLEDTKLSEPIYLTQIISISKSGEVESPTFEAYSRDFKINQIIKDEN